jgi:hypothetical protein
MIKVSFDFDDTLSNKSIQDFVKEIKDIVEVHITTSRYEDINNYEEAFLKAWELENNKKCSNDDLFKIAEELDIPLERIHFTNMNYKSVWFNDHTILDFKFHIDDNTHELYNIQDNTNIVAINSTINNWKEQCLTEINKYVN